VTSLADELIPGYRAVALLSRGKRLDTWDAYDEQRHVRCVVKILRADRRHEPGLREAVLREGHLATTFAHPHLVRGYDVVDDPAPALVLETRPGATLAAVIEDQPLDVPDLSLLGLQLASVLGYLHRHEWLHLDVKPANIVVDHGAAVLIDLSLAGRPGEGRPGGGTPGYLSPEQARGRGLGPASDVWGLGITLLECLTGELPYGDEAIWDSRRRWPLLHRRMPKAPADPPADLPPDLRQLLLGCVELDPAARPTLDDVRGVMGSLTGPGVCAGSGA